tara:strand:+ start:6541 stop:6906 length:366 start_codon:yes stop_codon:yes gene_type:complete
MSFNGAALSYLLRLQFLLWLAAATYLSLMTLEGTIAETLWDKPLHLIGWGGLYISLQLALRLQGPVLIAAAALLTYSLVVEILQAWVGRTFSLLDVLANGCGIALASMSLAALNWFLKKKA